MKHRHSLLLPFVLALPISLSAADALAQSPPAPAAPTSTQSEATQQTDSRALAETLFFTARGLMEGGRIAQACQKFAESYRLDAAAGTLLNLAVCHEKEGKVASAWGEFRQALADARKANRPDREQLAKDAIARLEPDLPFVTITVPPAMRVPGLQVSRNGVPLNEAAWDTELPIDPGTNEITVTAPDYDAEKKTITVEKKQHVTVTFDPLVYHPPPKPPPPFWTTKRIVGGTVLGVGVAAAVVGGVFGAQALSKKSTSDDNCPLLDGQRRCTQAGSDAMATAKTDAWIADVGVGVGVAAIVVGSFLIATGGAKEEDSPPPPQAAWGWDVRTGAHGVQGFLTHSF